MLLFLEFFDENTAERRVQDRHELAIRDPRCCSLKILGIVGTLKRRNTQATSAKAQSSVCENWYEVSKVWFRSSG